jgi:hypothetical protein
LEVCSRMLVNSYCPILGQFDVRVGENKDWGEV